VEIPGPLVCSAGGRVQDFAGGFLLEPFGRPPSLPIARSCSFVSHAARAFPPRLPSATA